MSSSPHLKMETDPVFGLCFLVFRILEDGQGPETQSFLEYSPYPFLLS
jgi:hypothetical protein